MDRTHEKFRVIFICSALTLITFAVFWQVRSFEFTNYDDDRYITENTHITSGLTIDNVRWVFTSPHYFMWHPVTSLTNMLDCQLFGLNAGRHHLTNLILHIANTLLLFAILKTMTGRIWPSAFVAAAFALHPLNVESVAWIAERKNLVSTLFWMLTIAAYVRYVRHRRFTNYFLVILAFSMALMSKPTTVTLPFALLLLDYWPLCRFQRSPAQKTQLKSSNRQLIIEKIPLFVLSAVLCVITIFTQKSGGVLNEHYPFDIRLTNALVSYVTYIVKMIYPSHLTAFYPHPGLSLPAWQPWASLIVLVVFSIAAISLGRRRPYLAVGWLWFLGTLVPVIGLVQAGSQAMADRYAYIPLIGLFIIIAWTADGLLKNWPHRKIALAVSAIVLLLASSVVAAKQTSYWRNSRTLFEHAVKVSKGNYLACFNLGVALTEQNKFDEAIDMFRRAVQIKPNYAAAYNNLGTTYDKLGRLQDEAEAFKQAIKVDPSFSLAYYNLGTTYRKLGRYQDEMEIFRRMRSIKPDSAEVYYNLGTAYGELGRFQDELDSYRNAIKIKPDYAEAYNNIGFVYSQLGRNDEAVQAFKQAIKIKPDYSQAYNNLGVLCDQLGRFEDSVQAYKNVIRLNPNDALAYNNLGGALGELNRYQESIQAFKEAARIKPDLADVHYNLGISYLTAGDKKSALAEYEILKKLDAEKANALLALIQK